MMRRPTTLPLAHVFGVRIGAAPSWFLFLGLAVVFLTRNFGTWIPSATNTELFLLAAVAALASTLFARSRRAAGERLQPPVGPRKIDLKRRGPGAISPSEGVPRAAGCRGRALCQIRMTNRCQN